METDNKVTKIKNIICRVSDRTLQTAENTETWGIMKESENNIKITRGLKDFKRSKVYKNL